ncbi:MAG: bifunctional diaminohydroxyphosphoribosylaminopyrimidine deaminase/5-amino-6-(5-phosphoribosylamino)uracil reductase RibD [Betaproteobacteria bacterium]|nr:bifunctional diaminohydroxyphosphoribosylaminopyrimidine deaminase/5-amino-6-(5-phosphoribosylamino)uracil reductase RibD [Betaproteobacteria bacterium]
MVDAAASGAWPAADDAWMARALALAGRGLFTTTPNPRVGCVLVRDGRVLGEGFHAVAGGLHAEAAALAAAGNDAAGATAYVTLEPCSHFGRTPPCADALVAAGVARVVAAMEDPNPKVAGRGFARLRAAGIEVSIGLRAAEALDLNIGFVSRMTRGRPWLRLKVAASLDGRTALSNRISQWITGEAARADGHHWRARSCAVLTGIGTVREDDPRLTVRALETPRQPLPVVVDSRLQLEPGAKLLDAGRALVFAAVDDPAARRALEARGAEVVLVPNASGKVDLPAMLQELGRRGINDVLVETGTRLNGSLLREGCVDELLAYVAPSVLGERALGMFDLPAMDELAQRATLRFTDVVRVGDDLRLRLQVERTPGPFPHR